MLLVGENAQRTAGLEGVTGGFILPVRWGEKKSQEGRDVVVRRSPVLSRCGCHWQHAVSTPGSRSW